ncbi:DNA-3-methyladenine glycosylase [Loigolactobacillus jiayinensis]|uniref:Putative 3-methyladenine DNA glycosylase n=1 Tax=Loigolactobacillus jiayinensis TaxID=2486016 RepID=A0ABW1RGR8_9LACO|nr:DNA-3-methyladenine glycosylase [Loigolactobacillus jiayinensis]
MNFADYFEQTATVTVAQQLLGAQLIYHSSAGLLSGYIVETEAYLGELDQAAHAFAGHRSAKNEALYRAGGTIYIYTIYGQFLLNVITQPAGVPQGVLVRGLQPNLGQNVMQLNQPQAKLAFDLTNGPGKLMAALGIQNLDLNLKSYATSALSLNLTDTKQPLQIIAAPRVGIKVKAKWQTAPLRFYVAHNPFVSKMPKRAMNLENYGWQN